MAATYWEFILIFKEYYALLTLFFIAGCISDYYEAKGRQ